MWFQQSPNYSAGRGGKQIEFIVCHWIVGDVSAADAVFRNKAYQTSAHYAVQSGVVHQYVREGDTAWHAGNFDVNQRSIGIEHRGGPNITIDNGTYEQSAQLIADICRRYGKRFPLRAHREFKATQCPGTLDLNRLNQRVSQLLSGSSQGVVMDTNAGKELYRTALHREAESDGAAGQWNGRTPASALSVLRGEGEWKSVDQKVRTYDSLAKQVSELSSRPTKAELESVVNSLKIAETKVQELEAQKTEDTKTLDQGAAAAQGIWGFIQGLLNRGKK